MRTSSVRWAFRGLARLKRSLSMISLESCYFSVVLIASLALRLSSCSRTWPGALMVLIRPHCKVPTFLLETLRRDSIQAGAGSPSLMHSLRREEDLKRWPTTMPQAPLLSQWLSQPSCRAKLMLTFTTLARWRRESSSCGTRSVKTSLMLSAALFSTILSSTVRHPSLLTR